MDKKRRDLFVCGFDEHNQAAKETLIDIVDGDLIIPKGSSGVTIQSAFDFLKASLPGNKSQEDIDDYTRSVKSMIIAPAVLLAWLKFKPILDSGALGPNWRPIWDKFVLTQLGLY